MFEKEAEEKGNEYIPLKKQNVYARLQRKGYKDGFQQGAEFGYNKANEWHDLRKDPNDLPNTHCGNWVIALYDNGILWCRARREEFVEGIFWVNSYHYQIYNVIAWKEIVLPELKESE